MNRLFIIVALYWGACTTNAQDYPVKPDTLTAACNWSLYKAKSSNYSDLEQKERLRCNHALYANQLYELEQRIIAKIRSEEETFWGPPEERITPFIRDARYFRQYATMCDNITSPNITGSGTSFFVEGCHNRLLKERMAFLEDTYSMKRKPPYAFIPQ